MQEIDPVTRSNKTCRNKGAVSKNAIVPKWVASLSLTHFKILDFGAGKDMAHVNSLREMGFTCVAGYEFGENITPDHIKILAPDSFDLIYASNVFNTHSDALMSAQALHLIKNTLHPRHSLVFNLPDSPNYFWTCKADFLNLVGEVFEATPAKVDKRGIYTIKSY